MSQYFYSPLSSGHANIRLLRLLPHEDESADIQCELYEYYLQDPCRTHLYEALSYVWGSTEKKPRIFMHGHRFDVTVNLHAALLRLRNHSTARVLWVDAICIDQNNLEEKGLQIQSMANIYSQAHCVIVWLGDAADDSDQALEEIRVTGGKISTHPTNKEVIKNAILALLQRPWFRRIWVLQEVAAARHILIVCGSTEIDGYAFCLGVELLKGLYDAQPDLQSLVRSVIYLIRGAIFRPKGLGRVSKEICPLGELIDMYHVHEATLHLDKVYALLGMSSDDLSKASLLPDYNVPWKDLFEKLTRFLLCKEIFVEASSDKEIAVIQSKGCILSKVSSVPSNISWNSGQGVDVIWRNRLGTLGFPGKRNSHWTLQSSAEPVMKGDVICLLQGASNPTIIRFCENY